MHNFVTSFIRQFFENCEDGNDMGCLEVVMHSETQFFFHHWHCIHFCGASFASTKPFHAGS